MFCTKCGSHIDSPSSECPNCGEATGENPTEQPKETVAATHDPMVGRVIATKYRIESRLGTGGMGTVYRTRRLMIGDVVALKLMQSIQVGDPKMIERFRREAQAAARLKHPNAVAVYDFGVSDDGSFYLVMELVEGQSLRTVIRERGPLTPTLAAKVVGQVCSALDEAHRQNIVHRDIKPDNIMVDFRGEEVRVKVLDFGIARMRDFAGATVTQSTMVMGTPHYMSPEQCLGEELDGRSDIYSMGIVTFEMLAGVVPFNSPTSTAVIIQHVNQTPPPLHMLNVSIPPTVEEVVLHALAKRREDRPQTAKTFAEEFRAVAEGRRMNSPMPGFEPTVPVRTPIQGIPPQTQTVPLPRRRWWTALVIAAVLLAAGIGAVLVLRRPAARKTTPVTPQQPASPIPAIHASAPAREIRLGQKLALRWNAKNSSRVVLRYAGSQVPVPLNGEYRIQPEAPGNGEADLIAYGENGNQATARVDFQVLPPGPAQPTAVVAPTIHASAAAEQIQMGQKLALRWDAKNSSRVLLRYAGQQIPVPLAGVYQIQPTAAGNGEVDLIAYGMNGKQATASVDFQVFPPAPPPPPVATSPTIEASASPDQVRLGQPVSLRWSAQNASRVILLYAGRKVPVPLAGQHQIFPSNAGPGQAYLIAFGANGQQVTSQVSFQVLPHGRPTVMILSPSIQSNGISAQAVTSSLVQHLMGQGYQVLATPYYVNSVVAAEQLPVSARPDYVVQTSLSATQAQITQSNTQKVISIFVKNLTPLYDVTVNCSATMQMSQVLNGQIVAQGSSSKSVHRNGVSASDTNQAALELAQQGLQQVLQDAMNQIPPPK